MEKCVSELPRAVPETKPTGSVVAVWENPAVAVARMMAEVIRYFLIVW
jgi:hypothetical protein